MKNLIKKNNVLLGSVEMKKADPRLKAYGVLGRNISENSFSTASFGNFVLTEGFDVKYVDISRFSPFSFEGEEFYLADTRAEDYRKPFLYQAQRNNTTSLVKLDLGDATVPEIDKTKLTFIFSIGRCGSTLLSKIMSASNYNEVSESDVFTTTGRSDVIDIATRIFVQHHSMNNEKTSFKFRSQTNRFVETYLKEFKEANFIFLYRNKFDWAKSFSGKFKWDFETLMHSYKQGCNTLSKMQDAGVSLKVIKYEELIENPAIFMTGKPSEDEMASILNVMSVDSQVQAGLDNSLKTYDENVVKKFMDVIALDLDIVRSGTIKNYLDTRL